MIRLVLLFVVPLVTPTGLLYLVARFCPAETRRVQERLPVRIGSRYPGRGSSCRVAAYDYFSFYNHRLSRTS